MGEKKQNKTTNYFLLLIFRLVQTKQKTICGGENKWMLLLFTLLHTGSLAIVSLDNDLKSKK